MAALKQNIMVAAGLVAGGCAADPPSTQARVVVVAIDGLDRPTLEARVAAGALPAFSRVMSEGLTADLNVSDPLLSPRIWTTIASGYDPDVHGVHGWMKRAGVMYAATDVAVDRVWEVASDHGLRSLVVGWLVTTPAVSLEGALLSDGFDGGIPMTATLENPDDHRIHPLDTERAAALSSSPRWARIARGCVPSDRTLAKHPLRAQVAAYGAPAHPLRHDLAVACAYERLDSRVQPDVAFLYLQGADQISHHFWPFVDPDAVAAMRADPDLRPRLAARDRTRQRGQRPYPWVDTPTTEAVLAAGASWVPDYYDVLDGILGDVLARVDPAHTTVIVLSDHGFQSSRSPTPGLYGEHRSPAVLLAWGHGVRAGATPRTPLWARDVAPTLYARLGLPAARDMTGRARTDLFDVTPVAPVATHRRAEPGAAPPKDALFDPRRMQQLEALGYIDDAGRPLPSAAGNSTESPPAGH